MKKVCNVLFLLAALLLPVLSVSATVYQIYVLPEDDIVYGRAWWSGGSASWTDVGANPNQVSHSYESGSGGQTYETELTFSLASLASVNPADIQAAVLKINILNMWDDEDDVVGYLLGAPVAYSGGTGLRSFDVLSDLVGLLNSSQSQAVYRFNYEGYSGFTFGSAEGQDPAYLEIVTRESGGGTPSVPEPTSLLLLGFGLAAIAVPARLKR